MQTVTSADGTRIAFDRRGDGPPLVMLHGGGTHRFWDPLCPRFTDDYTVLRPDRRGRGESGDTGEYSLDREVEDVLAVLDSVDGDPIVLGHSFGGLLAIEAARASSVATVAAYEPAVIVGEYAETADLADRMEARLRADERREAMKSHLAEVIHGGETDDIDRWLAEWPGWPDCVEHVENTLRMDRAVENYDLPDTLDVSAPTLVLSGTDGPSHLRTSARAVHEALPNSRFVDFANLGHLGPVEAPARVVGEIQTFAETAAVDETIGSQGDPEPKR